MHGREASTIKKGRGDKGSVGKKRLSLERFGIRLDWRSPPSVMQHSDAGNEEEVLLLTWGTLSDGLEDARKRDAGGLNPRVQASLLMEITGCDLYSRLTTRDAQKWLVDWFNKGNDDTTITTNIEIAERCPIFESS